MQRPYSNTKSIGAIGGLSALLLLLPAPSVAKLAGLQLHGFAAQSIMQAEQSSFINRKGELSLQQTDIGLNASYEINHKLRTAAQLIYINGDNRYPEGPRLDYLLLDWTLEEQQNWSCNLLLGRFKNNHWLYSSTRDVPHTTPSIILPQSVYFDAMRDAGLTIQGVGWHSQHFSPYGNVEFELSYGSGPLEDNTARHTLSHRAKGDSDTENAWIGSLRYSPLSQNWSAYVSYTDAEFSYTATDNEPFIDAETFLKRSMVGFIYSGANYELASEIFQEKMQVNDFLFNGYHTSTTAQGGYLQYRYFLTEHLITLLRLDIYDRNKDDRSGKQLEALGIPAHFGFMDDLTLGLQWKPSHNHNLNLQLEYHYVEGSGRLGPIVEMDIDANRDKYWSLWAMQIIYWF